MEFCFRMFWRCARLISDESIHVQTWKQSMHESKAYKHSKIICFCWPDVLFQWERLKSKYKFRGTKVCKAEEVRKYFVNPKIESFWLVCKLHYLWFGFHIYRSRRSKIFFGTGALENFVNFIKKRLQHRCFSVKSAKSLKASFLQNIYGDCFWKYLMNSFFTA